MPRRPGDQQPVQGRRARRCRDRAPEIVGGTNVRRDARDRARDFATALRLWREEAQKGDAQAMVNGGEMYAYAIGVPEDLAEAVR